MAEGATPAKCYETVQHLFFKQALKEIFLNVLPSLMRYMYIVHVHVA